MKIIIFLILSLMGWNLIASSSSDLFIIEESTLVNEFAELNQLEQELMYGTITPEIAQERYPQLLMPESSMNTMAGDKGRWRGLRGFDLYGCMWGVCCFPIGLFTVGLNPDEDRITKDSYWLGAGVSAGITTIIILTAFLIGG